MTQAQDFPDIPFEAWRPTKETLHLYAQIVGKIRMAMHPRMNHWWHVPLYVSPRGLTTGSIPYKDQSFEIEFDLSAHVLKIAKSGGRSEDFALYDGLSVADFYNSIFANLGKLGIECPIKAVPYEGPSTIPFADNTENATYDKDAVERAHRVLVTADGIFQQFRGHFNGKSTPVHMFWHSFDLALTRFSGKRAPIRDGANRVEREAYSHEVISFGFWFGDDNVPAPAFYAYAAPEPRGLSAEPLKPDGAKWAPSGGGHLALLMYEDVVNYPDPRKAVGDFLESAYRSSAKLLGWNVSDFEA